MNVLDFKDEAVFDVLYKKYWETLLSFARKYINDRETCKEIVQELFITLHVKRNSLAIKVSLSSYLYRSLHNKIVNHLRNESVYKRHVFVASQSNPVMYAGNEAEDWLACNELEKQINSCLSLMPVKYRRVFMLAIEEGISVKEMASLLKIPVATVDRQLRMARRLMQEHLARYKTFLQ
jgi:RNA polymerase sigma-70 factor (ECF subfamily)